MLKGKIEVI